jgi:hypothetical protein
MSYPFSICLHDCFPIRRRHLVADLSIDISIHVLAPVLAVDIDERCKHGTLLGKIFESVYRSVKELGPGSALMCSLNRVITAFQYPLANIRSARMYAFINTVM